MARRPRGVVVVSELFLKNETMLTTMHASRTRKPWYTSAAQSGSTGLQHQRLRWDTVGFDAHMRHFN